MIRPPPDSPNPKLTPVLTIISGGQTGADRAALDFAIAHGIAHGGWCPRGRRADDGVLDVRYKLRETESRNYRQRTRRNVEDSDATLILHLGELTDGSLYTFRCAERCGKPACVVALDAADCSAQVERVRAWLATHAVTVLNMAGPRESKCPGMHQQALAFLEALHAGSSTPFFGQMQ
ncbi:MAG TPA: putative molybdenum carrier protein [Rhodanobacteraceae bacterium]|nr:putative molybdenum carrier protein [Rhodanobacteraceae bacterium]